MVRSIGPLLFGLGVCAVCGCASLGSGQSAGSNYRAAHRETAASGSATNTVDTSGDSDVDADVDGAWSPSHANQQIAAARGSNRPRMSPVAQAGYEAAVDDAGTKPRRLGSAGDGNHVNVNPGSTEPAEPTDSKVVNALYEAEQGTKEYVVQIQGLQFDGGESVRLHNMLPTEPSMRTNPVSPLRSQVEGGRVVDSNSVSRVRELASSAPMPNFVARPPIDRIAIQAGYSAGAGPSELLETNWQVELDRVIARGEQELAALSPGTSTQSQAEYRRKQIQLRLLNLIAQHPEQALMAIPSLPPVEQEYWQQMVWAITDSLDADDQLSPRERAAQSIAPVNAALRLLREQSDLAIRNAAFCEEISYFGNYKRFPREEFVPGQPVLLYAEIENFRSVPSSSGEYRTSIRSMIEIQDANGQVRWNKVFDPTEDVCRNPRRDYFHNYQFSIPDSLRLGPHVLKLTVVDELSRKQSTCAIRFVVK